MTQIQRSIDADVPVSVAYNQWTQFESFPEFMSGVESITQIDDKSGPRSSSRVGAARPERGATTSRPTLEKRHAVEVSQKLSFTSTSSCGCELGEQSPTPLALTGHRPASS